MYPFPFPLSFVFSAVMFFVLFIIIIIIIIIGSINWNYVRFRIDPNGLTVQGAPVVWRLKHQVCVLE